MTIAFGREICGDLAIAQQREWLVTNGIGGYASGTVAGLATRCYHGLLVAALQPPLGRTLVVSHLDEIIRTDGQEIALATHRWADGSVSPTGFRYIEQFYLEGTIPCWDYAHAELLLQKRIWMQRQANTTIVQYHLHRGHHPIVLTLKAFVNYRDYHSRTTAGSWQMGIEPVQRGNYPGVCVFPMDNVAPIYLLASRGTVTPVHSWHYGIDLAAERDRGLHDRDDVLQAASITATLQPGESLYVFASTDPNPCPDAAASLQAYRQHEASLWHCCQTAQPAVAGHAPAWIRQLVLAADQFVVDRPLPDRADGKTIIAGYHWFADWGRDTMISLPGLTLTTGRPDIAQSVLGTFASYVSQGMLPNRFPDRGNPLTDGDYNTVDATLWYIEALRQYLEMTGDVDLLAHLFPVLEDIIHWHIQGTRYTIHRDPNDGLLCAGEPGVQLTWMDAKIGNWVVTPRIGKPVEINALWYCALSTMAHLANQVGKSATYYQTLAEAVHRGFSRFWQESQGYCYDVIDTPSGDDAALRPNQLFAISLPAGRAIPPLLSLPQQQQVVRACERSLLISYGLRSLAPSHPNYQGTYTGDPLHRDSAYHQGTAWGWLLGAFVAAHYAAFQDATAAKQFLQPIVHHLHTAGLGTISEIFDGDAPMQPQGCIAQAWSVAEVLRLWFQLETA
jgi:predicted glycogen debranching enzyme